MNKVCCNGTFYDEHEPLFTAANRSFRYGDGLFETIKVLRNEPLLFHLHWQRAMNGLQTVAIDTTPLAKEEIKAHIQTLCGYNNCTAAARVRWAMWRSEQGKVGYIIEASALAEDAFVFNEKGWMLGLHHSVRKSQDLLSNLKSANYLPYVMAGHYAAAEGLDECLILNANNTICDGSKTNLFLIRDSELFTPALHQGCVAGVMREHLIQSLKARGISAQETVITEADLVSAEEVFLTNAIQGIRWVASFGENIYRNSFSKHLYQQLLAPMYHH